MTYWKDKIWMADCCYTCKHSELNSYRGYVSIECSKVDTIPRSVKFYTICKYFERSQDADTVGEDEDPW